MKLHISPSIDAKCVNLQVIRDALAAVPEGTSVDLEVISQMPHLVVQRTRAGALEVISAPLLPEWLESSAMAPRLSTATVNFIASLCGSKPIESKTDGETRDG